jgi:hypothetical protein
MTNFKEFKSKSLHGGTQYLQIFDNGYGVSIIQHDFSYGGDRGLWELAVIKKNSKNEDGWDICYDTPITNDVLGHLSENEVNNVVEKVKALNLASKI